MHPALQSIATDDADIDCPLFQQLQVFLCREHGLDKATSLNQARKFMRCYWLVDSDADGDGAVQ